MKSTIPLIRYKLKLLPLKLLIMITAVYLLGLLVLYSASDCSFYPRVYKQLFYYMIFLFIAIIIALIDIDYIYKYSYVIYFIACVILMAVEVAGYKVMGAKRWIGVSGLRIQPSELTKISIIIVIARYFSDLDLYKIKKIRYSIVPLCLAILPTILTIRQPDLGTGIIILLITATMFFAAGVPIWQFGAASCIILLSAPIILNTLHDYQKRRIMVFFDPERDPHNAGYNIIQSKIAIGSGGLYGKGLTYGTQSHLHFLPEHQTDFIFACLAEELGFSGVLVLFVIYSIIISYSLFIAINARDHFSKLVTIGVISMFFWHILINISMVTGVAPVVGIPLPLISYGGTMIASILIGFGMVMNNYVKQNTALIPNS